MEFRDTDSEWQQISASDTYFKVLSDPRFKDDALDEDARRQFFESGEAHIGRVLEKIHTHLDAKFSPSSALDFGCGVGRLLLPLSRICDRVVGVDIAEPMLREARANLDAGDVRNVELVKGDDRLSKVTGRFDLIHSYIVFQHIPALRGRQMIARMLELLDEDGCGALHVVYSRDQLAGQLEKMWPDDDSVLSYLGRAWQVMRRKLRRTRRTLLGRSPRTEMNPYSLNAILHELQEAAVRRLHVEFTDHSGYYGAMLLFQRARDLSYQA